MADDINVNVNPTNNMGGGDQQEQDGLGLTTTTTTPAIEDGDGSHMDNPNNNTNANNLQCRICHDAASDTDPLFRPCKCSGSIAYVHQPCLEAWLAHSRQPACELCSAPFAFSHQYRDDMPVVLPGWLVAREAILALLRRTADLCRWIVVAAGWVLVVPSLVGYLWHGLMTFYSYDDGENGRRVPVGASLLPAWVPSHLIEYYIMCVGSLTTAFLVVLAKDWVVETVGELLAAERRVLRDRARRIERDLVRMRPVAPPPPPPPPHVVPAPAAPVAAPARVAPPPPPPPPLVFAARRIPTIIPPRPADIPLPPSPVRATSTPHAMYDSDDADHITWDGAERAQRFVPVAPLPPPPPPMPPVRRARLVPRAVRAGSLPHGTLPLSPSSSIVTAAAAAGGVAEPRRTQSERTGDDTAATDRFGPVRTFTGRPPVAFDFAFGHQQQVLATGFGQALTDGTSAAVPVPTALGPPLVTSSPEAMPRTVSPVHVGPAVASSLFASVSGSVIASVPASSTATAAATASASASASATVSASVPALAPVPASVAATATATAAPAAAPAATATAAAAPAEQLVEEPVEDMIDAERAALLQRLNALVQDINDGLDDAAAAPQARAAAAALAPVLAAAAPAPAAANPNANGVPPPRRAPAAAPPAAQPQPPPAPAAADADDDADNPDGPILGPGLAELLGFAGPAANVVQGLGFTSVVLVAIVLLTQWIPFMIGRLALELNPAALLLSAGRAVVKAADYTADAAAYWLSGGAAAAPWAPGPVSVSIGEGAITAAVVTSTTGRYRDTLFPHVLVRVVDAIDAVALLSTRIAHGTGVSPRAPYSSWTVRYAVVALGWVVIAGLVALYVGAAQRHSKRAKIAIKLAKAAITSSARGLKVVIFVLVEWLVFPAFQGFLMHALLVWIVPPSNGILGRASWCLEHPASAFAIHWVTGAKTLFLLSNLIEAVRSLTRPGVMWFVRDPNSPDFQPFQDILSKPIKVLLRKILASVFVYLVFAVLVGGTATALILATVGTLRTPSVTLWSTPVDLLIIGAIAPWIAGRLPLYKALRGLMWLTLVSGGRVLRLTSFLFGGYYPDEVPPAAPLSVGKSILTALDRVAGKRVLFPAHTAPVRATLAPTAASHPLLAAVQVSMPTAATDDTLTAGTKPTRGAGVYRVPGYDMLPVPETSGTHMFFPASPETGEPLYDTPAATARPEHWTLVWLPHGFFTWRWRALVLWMMAVLAITCAFVVAVPIAVGREIIPALVEVWVRVAAVAELLESSSSSPMSPWWAMEAVAAALTHLGADDPLAAIATEICAGRVHDAYAWIAGAAQIAFTAGAAVAVSTALTVVTVAPPGAVPAAARMHRLDAVVRRARMLATWTYLAVTAGILWPTFFGWTLDAVVAKPIGFALGVPELSVGTWSDMWALGFLVMQLVVLMAEWVTPEGELVLAIADIFRHGWGRLDLAPYHAAIQLPLLRASLAYLMGVRVLELVLQTASHSVAALIVAGYQLPDWVPLVAALVETPAARATLAAPMAAMALVWRAADAAIGGDHGLVAQWETRVRDREYLLRRVLRDRPPEQGRDLAVEADHGAVVAEVVGPEEEGVEAH
ncbi:hypothetical protein BC828DRAFT_196247 [Blastocladiella britannica]|nr:hypothetical protein BC828DRAFT_196247 [Blastocladiella britannica]